MNDGTFSGPRGLGETLTGRERRVGDGERASDQSKPPVSPVNFAWMRESSESAPCRPGRCGDEWVTHQMVREKNGGGVTRNGLRESNSAPAKPGYANRIVPASRQIKLKSTFLESFAHILNSGRQRPSLGLGLASRSATGVSPLSD
jgi:hypothetical protein